MGGVCIADRCECFCGWTGDYCDTRGRKNVERERKVLHATTKLSPPSLTVIIYSSVHLANLILAACPCSQSGGYCDGYGGCSCFPGYTGQYCEERLGKEEAHRQGVWYNTLYVYVYGALEHIIRKLCQVVLAPNISSFVPLPLQSSLRLCEQWNLHGQHQYLCVPSRIHWIPL